METYFYYLMSILLFTAIAVSLYSIIRTIQHFDDFFSEEFTAADLIRFLEITARNVCLVVLNIAALFIFLRE